MNKEHHKFKAGDIVRIKKIDKILSPFSETSDKESYKLGQDNGNISPFVGYEAEGIIMNPPDIGTYLKLIRFKRNGVQKDGFYSTSVIKEINGDTFETLNSIYKLEKIDELN